MEEIAGPGCGWENSSIDIEWKATLFWYWNPIAVVRYIIQYSLFKDHLSYATVKPMDSSGERIYAEIFTMDWWRKLRASFLLLSERLFQVRNVEFGWVRASGKSCQTERIREILSKRSYQRDHVSKSMLERFYQRKLLREIVTECASGSISESIRVIPSERAYLSLWPRYGVRFIMLGKVGCHDCQL